MLTRPQVAKRLGKSVATVRRMEGNELFPTRDERGIYRFDPDEVERVAQADRTRLPRSTPHRTAELDELHDRLAEVEAEREADRELEEMRRRHEEWRERHAAQQREREEQERHEAEAKRLHELQEEHERLQESIAQQKLEFAESLTRRDIARLDDDEFERLMDLLEP